MGWCPIGYKSSREELGSRYRDDLCVKMNESKRQFCAKHGLLNILKAIRTMYMAPLTLTQMMHETVSINFCLTPHKLYVPRSASATVTYESSHQGPACFSDGHVVSLDLRQVRSSSDQLLFLNEGYSSLDLASSLGTLKIVSAALGDQLCVNQRSASCVNLHGDEVFTLELTA